MPDRERPQTADPEADDSPYTVAAALGHPLPTPVGAQVWIAHVSTPSGETDRDRAFPTRQLALAWVASYARAYWTDRSGHSPEPSKDTADGLVVAAYFSDTANDEDWSIASFTVCGHVPDDFPEY